MPFRRYGSVSFVARLASAAVATMALYLTLWHNGDRLKDRLFASRRMTTDTYDFIVVGAGSAGAVVAHRLSEKFNVLLLEAGGEPFPLSNIPAFTMYLLNYPTHDWNFRTIPQKGACLAFENQQSAWSQGKVLGGSSTINFMAHTRGHPRDYDTWANMTGDSRWSYDNLLPFFKKSEDFAGAYELTGLHGKAGPLRIQIPDDGQHAVAGNTFVQAAIENGYAKQDMNGRFSEGFDRVYYPIKNGQRQSTFNAFLRPIRRRKSLTIAKFAHVNKVLLRKGTNEAYGVEYERHGRTRQARATKEVILSAGSLQSPKLLMLSGIGPKEHLQSMRIDVLVDSPGVGQNMQDHASTALGPFISQSSVPSTVNLQRDLRAREVFNYLTRGSGIFANSGLSGMGYVSTSYAKADGEGDWPDIQLMYQGVGVYPRWAEHFSHGFHLRRDLMERYFRNAVNKDSFLIMTSMSRPRQRGEIKLNSKNPKTPPYIDPKYLQDEQDVRVGIEGIKKAVNLIETAPIYQKLQTGFTNVSFPGCEQCEFRTDAYWECYLRHLTITLSHYVGTCSMGPPGSKEAVVDSQLRVNGVKNLRVIDASIAPKLPVSNTNAMAIMIGERGAEFILQSWTTPSSKTALPPNTLPSTPTRVSTTTTTTEPPSPLDVTSLESFLNQTLASFPSPNAAPAPATGDGPPNILPSLDSDETSPDLDNAQQPFQTVDQGSNLDYPVIGDIGSSSGGDADGKPRPRPPFQDLLDSLDKASSSSSAKPSSVLQESITESVNKFSPSLSPPTSTESAMQSSSSTLSDSDEEAIFGLSQSIFEGDEKDPGRSLNSTSPQSSPPASAFDFPSMFDSDTDESANQQNSTLPRGRSANSGNTLGTSTILPDSQSLTTPPTSSYSPAVLQVETTAPSTLTPRDANQTRGESYKLDNESVTIPVYDIQETDTSELDGVKKQSHPSATISAVIADNGGTTLPPVKVTVESDIESSSEGVPISTSEANSTEKSDDFSEISSTQLPISSSTAVPEIQTTVDNTIESSMDYTAPPSSSTQSISPSSTSSSSTENSTLRPASTSFMGIDSETKSSLLEDALSTPTSPTSPPPTIQYSEAGLFENQAETTTLRASQTSSTTTSPAQNGTITKLVFDSTVSVPENTNSSYMNIAMLIAATTGHQNTSTTTQLPPQENLQDGKLNESLATPSPEGAGSTTFETTLPPSLENLGTYETVTQALIKDTSTPQVMESFTMPVENTQDVNPTTASVITTTPAATSTGSGSATFTAELEQHDQVTTIRIPVPTLPTSTRSGGPSKSTNDYDDLTEKSALDLVDPSKRESSEESEKIPAVSSTLGTTSSASTTTQVAQVVTVSSTSSPSPTTEEASNYEIVLGDVVTSRRNLETQNLIRQSTTPESILLFTTTSTTTPSVGDSVETTQPSPANIMKGVSDENHINLTQTEETLTVVSSTSASATTENVVNVQDSLSSATTEVNDSYSTSPKSSTSDTEIKMSTPTVFDLQSSTIRSKVISMTTKQDLIRVPSDNVSAENNLINDRTTVQQEELTVKKTTTNSPFLPIKDSPDSEETSLSTIPVADNATTESTPFSLVPPTQTSSTSEPSTSLPSISLTEQLTTKVVEVVVGSSTSTLRNEEPVFETTDSKIPTSVDTLVTQNDPQVSPKPEPDVSSSTVIPITTTYFPALSQIFSSSDATEPSVSFSSSTLSAPVPSTESISAPTLPPNPSSKSAVEQYLVIHSEAVPETTPETQPISESTRLDYEKSTQIPTITSSPTSGTTGSNLAITTASVQEIPERSSTPISPRKSKTLPDPDLDFINEIHSPTNIELPSSEKTTISTVSLEIDSDTFSTPSPIKDLPVINLKEGSEVNMTLLPTTTTASPHQQDGNIMKIIAQFPNLNKEVPTKPDNFDKLLNESKEIKDSQSKSNYELTRPPEPALPDAEAPDKLTTSTEKLKESDADKLPIETLTEKPLIPLTSSPDEVTSSFPISDNKDAHTLDQFISTTPSSISKLTIKSVVATTQPDETSTASSSPSQEIPAMNTSPTEKLTSVSSTLELSGDMFTEKATSTTFKPPEESSIFQTSEATTLNAETKSTTPPSKILSPTTPPSEMPTTIDSISLQDEDSSFITIEPEDLRNDSRDPNVQNLLSEISSTSQRLPTTTPFITESPSPMTTTQDSFTQDLQVIKLITQVHLTTTLNPPTETITSSNPPRDQVVTLSKVTTEIPKELTQTTPVVSSSDSDQTTPANSPAPAIHDTTTQKSQRQENSLTSTVLNRQVSRDSTSTPDPDFDLLANTVVTTEKTYPPHVSTVSPSESSSTSTAAEADVVTETSPASTTKPGPSSPSAPSTVRSTYENMSTDIGQVSETTTSLPNEIPTDKITMSNSVTPSTSTKSSFTEVPTTSETISIESSVKVTHGPESSDLPRSQSTEAKATITPDVSAKPHSPTPLTDDSKILPMETTTLPSDLDVSFPRRNDKILQIQPYPSDVDLVPPTPSSGSSSHGQDETTTNPTLEHEGVQKAEVKPVEPLSDLSKSDISTLPTIFTETDAPTTSQVLPTDATKSTTPSSLKPQTTIQTDGPQKFDIEQTTPAADIVTDPTKFEQSSAQTPAPALTTPGPEIGETSTLKQIMDAVTTITSSIFEGSSEENELPTGRKIPFGFVLSPVSSPASSTPSTSTVTIHLAERTTTERVSDSDLDVDQITEKQQANLDEIQPETTQTLLNLGTVPTQTTSETTSEPLPTKSSAAEAKLDSSIDSTSMSTTSDFNDDTTPTTAFPKTESETRKSTETSTLIPTGSLLTDPVQSESTDDAQNQTTVLVSSTDKTLTTITEESETLSPPSDSAYLQPNIPKNIDLTENIIVTIPEVTETAAASGTTTMPTSLDLESSQLGKITEMALLKFTISPETLGAPATTYRPIPDSQLTKESTTASMVSSPTESETAITTHDPATTFPATEQSLEYTTEYSTNSPKSTSSTSSIPNTNPPIATEIPESEKPEVEPFNTARSTLPDGHDSDASTIRIQVKTTLMNPQTEFLTTTSPSPELFDEEADPAFNEIISRVTPREGKSIETSTVHTESNTLDAISDEETTVEPPQTSSNLAAPTPTILDFATQFFTTTSADTIETTTTSSRAQSIELEPQKNMEDEVTEIPNYTDQYQTTSSTTPSTLTPLSNNSTPYSDTTDPDFPLTTTASSELQSHSEIITDPSPAYSESLETTTISTSAVPTSKVIETTIENTVDSTTSETQLTTTFIPDQTEHTTSFPSGLTQIHSISTSSHTFHTTQSSIKAQKTEPPLTQTTETSQEETFSTLPPSTIMPTEQEGFPSTFPQTSTPPQIPTRERSGKALETLSTQVTHDPETSPATSEEAMTTPDGALLDSYTVAPATEDTTPASTSEQDEYETSTSSAQLEEASTLSPAPPQIIVVKTPPAITQVNVFNETDIGLEVDSTTTDASIQETTTVETESTTLSSITDLITRVYQSLTSIRTTQSSTAEMTGKSLTSTRRAKTLSSTRVDKSTQSVQASASSSSGAKTNQSHHEQTKTLTTLPSEDKTLPESSTSSVLEETTLLPALLQIEVLSTPAEKAEPTEPTTVLPTSEDSADLTASSTELPFTVTEATDYSIATEKESEQTTQPSLEEQTTLEGNSTNLQLGTIETTTSEVPTSTAHSTNLSVVQIEIQTTTLPASEENISETTPLTTQTIKLDSSTRKQLHITTPKQENNDVETTTANPAYPPDQTEATHPQSTTPQPLFTDSNSETSTLPQANTEATFEMTTLILENQMLKRNPKLLNVYNFKHSSTSTPNYIDYQTQEQLDITTTISEIPTTTTLPQPTDLPPVATSTLIPEDFLPDLPGPSTEQVKSNVETSTILPAYTTTPSIDVATGVPPNITDSPTLLPRDDYVQEPTTTPTLTKLSNEGAPLTNLPPTDQPSTIPSTDTTDSPLYVEAVSSDSFSTSIDVTTSLPHKPDTTFIPLDEITTPESFSTLPPREGRQKSLNLFSQNINSIAQEAEKVKGVNEPMFIDDPSDNTTTAQPETSTFSDTTSAVNAPYDASTMTEFQQIYKETTFSTPGTAVSAQSEFTDTTEPDFQTTPFLESTTSNFTDSGPPTTLQSEVTLPDLQLDPTHLLNTTKTNVSKAVVDDKDMGSSLIPPRLLMIFGLFLAALGSMNSRLL